MLRHFKFNPSVLGLLLLPILISAANLTNTQSSSKQKCLFLPEDSEWPSHDEWSELNKTINGRLIATIPLASVCHDPNFNETACAALVTGWILPQTHFNSSSSFMSPFWQNQSCDPFTPKSTPCRLGNYVDYAVNVSSAADVAVGLKFAQEKNIRLVIKNTGHDYLGKSAGRGGLEIWTHNLKSIDSLNFTSESYTGPAIKIGAGVQAFEVYEAAAARGLRIVGGECATVGIAGGYTQGGGHSALSSTYGLGADQTLEWELVTANGTQLIASPTENTDLYFALSGGGGGTYGVVLSLTVKAHEDGIVGGAAVSFNTSDISEDTFWKGVEVFQTLLPSIVDTGATVLYSLTNGSFGISPITSPGSSEAEMTAMIQPLLSELKKLGIPNIVSVTSVPTYLEHFQLYFGTLPFGSDFINRIDETLGSRLIPRDVVQNAKSNSALAAASKLTVGFEGFAIGALAINVSHAVAKNIPSTNAVLPAWRDALIHFIILTPWNFTAPLSVNHAVVNDQLVDVILPALEAVAPDSGAYLNEAVWLQTNFQETFYGDNYETLKGIKKLHDPEDLFYAITAVGSEAWEVGDNGRLCKSFL